MRSRLLMTARQFRTMPSTAGSPPITRGWAWSMWPARWAAYAAAFFSRHANDSTLGVFVLCGAFFGVFASRLLIYLADRWLRVDLAQPVGYGLIGGIWGGAVSSVIAPVIGWSTLPILALILAGAISGVMVGRTRYGKEDIFPDKAGRLGSHVVAMVACARHRRARNECEGSSRCHHVRCQWLRKPENHRHA